MRETSPHTLEVLADAAALRSGGATWGQVARRLGYRSADTARHLQTRHPLEWAAAVARARRQVLDDVRAEALAVERKLLRPAEPVTVKGRLLQAAAADRLLRHCRRSRACRLRVTLQTSAPPTLPLAARLAITAVLDQGDAPPPP